MMLEHSMRRGQSFQIPPRRGMIAAGLVVTVFVGAASVVQAEFTHHGALACKSLQLYKELEHDNFSGFQKYLMSTSPPCTVLPANAIAKVVSRNGAYVGFTVDETFFSGTLWARRTALRRRKQPEHGNIVVDDGIQGPCQMLSRDTQSYNQWSRILATSVLNQTRPAAVPRATYQMAIDKNNYELVVQPSGGKCIAELDIEGEPLLGCVADSKKYHSCRYGTSEALKKSAACQTLCTATAAVQRPSPASESRTLQNAKDRQHKAAIALRMREIANLPAAVRRYLERYSVKPATPAAEGSCSKVSSLLASDKILARMLGGAVRSVYRDGDFATFSYGGLVDQGYSESIDKDAFTLSLRWTKHNCQATFKTRVDAALPILACVVRPDAVLNCLEKAGSGFDAAIARGMCLSDMACVK